MERYRIVVSIKVKEADRKRQYQVLDREKRERGLPTYYGSEDAANKDCAEIKEAHGLNIYVTPCLTIPGAI